tara:strand:- start:879 stop:2108 length:1230 start_codon:yes stop_codon:yes gene_type:complete
MRSILILLLIPIIASSDTTENLIINGTFESGNSNGWTTSGDVQVLNDCCGSNYDLEFGDSGSIEQTFNLTSDEITTQMLDNGITLNSSVQVQNGECQLQGCWGGQGGADSFRIDLSILDENSQVLATVSQIRYDITDINGKYFEDTVSYTGTGSYFGNIFIKSEDANAPATLGSANVDNISVTMDYSPIVLSLEQKSEINTAVEKVEEVKIEQYKFEEVKVNIIEEEIKIEEVKFEEEMKLEEKEFIEETIVFRPEEVIFEGEVVEEPKVEEVYEEIVESPIENTNETETIEEEERDTEVAQSSGDTIEAETDQDNSRSVEITVEEISTKVAEKIESVDEQLKAIQFITAKVMQRNDMISSYSQVNAEIFKQPVIIDTDINSYLNQTYVDIRDIYSNNVYEDRQDWTSR